MTFRESFKEEIDKWSDGRAWTPKMEQNIIDLVREKARQTAHECTVGKMNIYSLHNPPSCGHCHIHYNRCITQTHKNIDAKFDEWGKL